MKKHLVKWILGILFLCLLVFYVSRLLWYNYRIPQVEPDIVIHEPKLLYGLPVDSFNVEKNRVERNQNLSDILLSRGVSPNAIDKIARNSTAVFDVRKLKVGNDYAVFYSKDSLHIPLYFVYREDPVHYYLYELKSDSLKVKAAQFGVELRRKISSGVITSSLWNAMKDNNLDPLMAIQLSDIYAWTIDFFSLQKGDRFRFVYDEIYVDSISIGVRNIYAAQFDYYGKEIYAFRFEKNDSVGYYNEKGENLQKEFLKAPLKFFHISSRFSSGRMHPILRIVRPHHGVDYAAPKGTPVMSIGEGTVISKGWAGGGGNTLKIRHNSVYTTVYMHLAGYAGGISQGSRVRQGQVIGFVGSTGLSTGPHLDFRVYRGGSAVNPLTIESPPAKPVDSKYMPEYIAMKDSLLKDLQKIEWKSFNSKK